VAYNTGEYHVELEELNARVEATLGGLPARCREIFLLHRDAQMTYQEIETLLGISNATIRNQMSRAMRAIAKVIEEWRAGD
jgi:RNA polymerase sigma-70 factor (ECF subfamily)